MRLFRIKNGIIIEKSGNYYRLRNIDWDIFLNDDDLNQKMINITAEMNPVENGLKMLEKAFLPPIQSQEIWASGVTYFNSKMGRQEESKNAGGGQFYAHVYEAERPELFFKANAARTTGHYGMVRIRKDSSWNVPEPELTLAITTSGKIIGYTIGNDMSSRSIEGENPLYLPQAKTYDGCASIGPGIYVSEKYLDLNTEIHMTIHRKEQIVFEGKVSIQQMKRTMEELVSFLFRENSFPFGCFLMTGTGIIPPPEFTLYSGDVIRITIHPIGTLLNTVN